MRSWASSMSASGAGGASRRSSASPTPEISKPVFDRVEPLRAFGVAMPHFVLTAGGPA